MDLVTISDNMVQKPLFYAHFWHFFGQMPLGNNVAKAHPKISGDQKLFERVCSIYWKYLVNLRGSPRDRVGDLPLFFARGVRAFAIHLCPGVGGICH